MALKGEVRATAEIPVGSVVEIVREPQPLPSYYYSKNPEMGLVGVLAHSHAEGAGQYRRFNGTVMSLQGGKFERHSVFESGERPPLFKVLTGLRRKAVLEAWQGPAGLATADCGRGIQVGSDPEVFVVDEAGVVIPAWKFLGKKPKATSDYEATAFWDGYQAEFTIPPSHCHAYVMDTVRNGLWKVREAARKVNPKARLTYQCVLPIPKEMMDAAAAESEEYVQLGCAPSHNVYEDDSPLRVVEGKLCPIRFAGFHVHHGYGKLLPEQVKAVVKAMDAICGVALVLVCQGMESEDRRRFYGRAGEHRVPKHGIEWRVPSSAVLAHPVMCHLTLDLARAAGKLGLLGMGKCWKASEEETRTAINELDVELARKIVERNKGVLETILGKVYGAGTTTVQKALRLISEGGKKLLDVEDMSKNWRLDGSWDYHSESQNAQVAKAKFVC
jgi:hypothetical protein